MAVLFAQVLVATTGLAHALASWQYFARISSRGCWIWPLAWAIGTLASLVLMQSAPLAGFTAFLAL
ncbi:MAG TPA: hypothetical protein PK264_15315, partial [Hyphomicrobiaceae bacterium]|nr:hypothetical protein [Hyphomicrobiaceae bacterium]